MYGNMLYCIQIDKSYEYKEVVMFYLLQALYYLIPAAAILFFIISLIVYLSAVRKNKRTPGIYTAGQMKVRLICLIVSSVIAGILAFVVLGFMVLLFMAVAFM